MRAYLSSSGKTIQNDHHFSCIFVRYHVLILGSISKWHKDELQEAKHALIGVVYDRSRCFPRQSSTQFWSNVSNSGQRWNQCLTIRPCQLGCSMDRYATLPNLCTTRMATLAEGPALFLCLPLQT